MGDVETVVYRPVPTNNAQNFLRFYSKFKNFMQILPLNPSGRQSKIGLQS